MTGVVGYGKEGHWDTVPFSSGHVRGTRCQCDLSPSMLTRVTAGACLSGDVPPPPLSYRPVLGRGGLHAQPRPGDQGIFRNPGAVGQHLSLLRSNPVTASPALGIQLTTWPWPVFSVVRASVCPPKGLRFNSQLRAHTWVSGSIPAPRLGTCWR